MDGAPPILEFARARAGEGESVWLGEEHGSEFESREEAPRHFCDGAVSGGHKSRNSAENVGENDDDDAENNDGKAVVDQVEIGRLSPSGERNHATRFPIDLAQSSTISPPAFAPSMVSEHLRHPESNFGGFQHQKDTVISHVRPGDHGLEQENAKDQGAEVAALKNVQGRKQSIQLPPKHVGQHHHVGVPRDDDPSHEIDAFLKIFEDEESAAGAERPPTVAYNNAAVDFQQQQVQPQHHHQHIHSQQFNRQQFQSWQEQDVLHRIALPVAASQQRFLYYRQQHQQQPHHHHYHQQQQHHQKLVDEAGRVAHLGQQGLPKGMFAYEFPKYPAEVSIRQSTFFRLDFLF